MSCTMQLWYTKPLTHHPARKRAEEIKILENEIPIMTMLDQRKVQNGLPRYDSDKKDSENQPEISHKTCSYVPAVFALTKTEQEHAPTLQRLLEAQHLDPECQQILSIVKTAKQLHHGHTRPCNMHGITRYGNRSMYIRRLPPCNPSLVPIFDIRRLSRGNKYVRDSTRSIPLATYRKRHVRDSQGLRIVHAWLNEKKTTTRTTVVFGEKQQKFNAINI